MGCKPLDKPKQKHKKGLWSPDEDLKLKNYILKHGHGCWSSVPVNAGLQRNGKSCRLRWINYLRPGLKRGMFSVEEEETILTLHGMLGNKWSQMAQHLPGRTDNEIKNFWHSYLKKKVAKMGETEAQAKAENSISSTNNLESSRSSVKSTTPNLTVESIEHLEGSLITDTEQSVSQYQMNFPREACKSNLPRVLFTEWLSLEQFRDQQNSCEKSENTNIVARNNFDYYNNSEFQDAFMHHDLLFDEVSFSTTNGIHQGPNNGTVDDILLQPQLKFEDHISENGFVDFINGQFNISSDVLYL
ncbi:hypothetical protein ACH5RR_017098 [Cinchona calisaya]|uniref:Uncharacterized protein n=1 Tax=Cinchona calisaya TaxID=153742 RepID=A0ABD2ZXU0_9GENT